MSDTSETDMFTERVDVTTQPDGAFIGRLEIGAVSASHPREDADALRAEILTLKARIHELERQVLEPTSERSFSTEFEESQAGATLSA